MLFDQQHNASYPHSVLMKDEHSQILLGRMIRTGQQGDEHNMWQDAQMREKKQKENSNTHLLMTSVPKMIVSSFGSYRT